MVRNLPEPHSLPYRQESRSSAPSQNCWEGKICQSIWHRWRRGKGRRTSALACTNSPAGPEGSVPIQADPETSTRNPRRLVSWPPTCRSGEPATSAKDPVCCPQAVNCVSPSKIGQLSVLLFYGLSFIVLFGFSSWEWFSQKEGCAGTVLNR